MEVEICIGDIYLVKQEKSHVLVVVVGSNVQWRDPVLSLGVDGCFS